MVYRKYKVWEKSHDFALHVYQLTTCFPDSEKFNLIAQLRRAATSIPTNAIQECLELAEEIKKMLAALIRKIKSSSNF